MANTDNPFGLRAVGSSGGGGYDGNTITCVIPSSDGTATFVGDIVKLTAAGVTAATDGGTYPGVVQGTAGAQVFGVVAGFEPDRDDLSKQYRVASTERICRVIPASDVLFAVQEDSVGAPLALTDVGQQIDFIVGSGDTTTGMSGVEIDSSSTATNAQALLLGLYNAADNEIGDNATWLVKIVETQLGTAAAAGDS